LLGLGEVLNRKLASKGAFPVEKKICAFKIATDPAAAHNGKLFNACFFEALCLSVLARRWLHEA
jgi:hypothetical protein